jgi:hypothetical protein
MNSETVQGCFFPVLWAVLLLDASLVCGAFLLEFSGEFWSLAGPQKAGRALRRIFGAVLLPVFLAAAEGRIRITAGNRPRWF